jgi:ABC-type multidrug transport system fused ATPase/permease subunit
VWRNASWKLRLSEAFFAALRPAVAMRALARKRREHDRDATKNADLEARVVELINAMPVVSARTTRAGGGTATAASTTLRASAGTEHRLRLHRQQAFALQLLAGELARTAHRFSLFASLLLGGFFVMTAELHLAENPLALHLLLQRLEGLIDIVIADEYLQAASSFGELA